jgi:hypothetical protein
MIEENKSLAQSPPQTAPKQTKKVPPRGTVKRREYDRLKKAASRERQRQERLCSSVPASSDYEVPEAQRHALDAHSQPILAQITRELAHPLECEDERIIIEMADALLAHERGWTQRVHSPDGMLYGGHFLDGTISHAINRVHRFPALLGSTTLSALYEDFLKLAEKLVDQPWFEKQFAEELELELAGRFEFPPEPSQ